MSKKVLVAYASVSGSTGEVAKAIGEVLAQEGAMVQVQHVKDVTSLSGYDAVVLGSSIRAGKWLPEAMNFLGMHREALSEIPVAYFTTCLTMVQDTEDNRQIVLAYLEPVRQRAPQIKPVGVGLFAGALDPTRQLAMPVQGPQGDYRNWEAIRTWAEEICPALLEGRLEIEEPIMLRGAILSYTDMSGTDLSRVDLHGAKLKEAKLSEADLHDTDLGEADLIKADLRKANLHEAGLNWANMNWADLSGANLHRANLIGADLSQANLSQANLSQAILNGANLSRANLSGTDLSYADLNWVDLRGADLSRANLRGANLGWANLSGADLSQANLSQARYNSSTEWPEGFSAEMHGVILVGEPR